jgi:hypothetical protein
MSGEWKSGTGPVWVALWGAIALLALKIFTVLV